MRCRHTIHHSVEQGTVSQASLTQPGETLQDSLLPVERDCLADAREGPERLRHMLPSLWLEMHAFEKWDLLSRDQGDDAHHEMQVHHYLPPSSAADRFMATQV